jgi:hypothetical protein
MQLIANAAILKLHKNHFFYIFIFFPKKIKIIIKVKKMKNYDRIPDVYNFLLLKSREHK